jgi:hypothetical protein
MLGVLERPDRQCDGLGDAFHGQVADDLGRPIAFEDNGSRLKRGGREFAGIEKIGSPDIGIEQIRTRVDGRHIDRHVHGRAVGRRIQHHRAGRFVESGLLRRETQMPIFETRKRVVAVDDVGDRRGICGAAQQQRQRSG